MAKQITKRQQEVLNFIIESIRDQGLPPTIAELCERFSISSTNGANDHLVALEKKGYIERTSKARGITITSKASTILYQHGAAMAPLVGTVAAGMPVLAEENIEDHIPVAADVAERGGFCLRVRGDSMIDAGILEGDIVVVDSSRRAKPGDVVVALVDEDDATVKYFHPKGHDIELVPANSTMEPIVVPGESVHIQGVVVSLQRAL